MATASQAPDPIATQLVQSAQEAFTSGVNIVAIAVLIGLAALATVGLRHVPTVGAAPADSEPPAEPEKTVHSAS